MRIKNIPTYNVNLWDINNDQIEYYDIMSYLVESWKDEKKRRHKIWDYDHKFSKDDTRMPETHSSLKRAMDKNVAVSKMEITSNPNIMHIFALSTECQFGPAENTTRECAPVC